MAEDGMINAALKETDPDEIKIHIRNMQTEWRIGKDINPEKEALFQKLLAILREKLSAEELEELNAEDRMITTALEATDPDEINRHIRNMQTEWRIGEGIKPEKEALFLKILPLLREKLSAEESATVTTVTTAGGKRKTRKRKFRKNKV
jgi:mannose/fructose/N-acetylgalactosamine-specific phosphotransferase system component IIB